MASITWYRRGKPVWTDQHGGVGSAKSSAKAYFEKHKKEIGIERVEVRDDAGDLCFHLPKPLTRP